MELDGAELTDGAAFTTPELPIEDAVAALYGTENPLLPPPNPEFIPGLRGGM